MVTQKKDPKRTKTAGELSNELLQKPAEAITPREQSELNYKDYEKNVAECVSTYSATYHNDFYVIAMLKKEKLLENMTRTFYYARKSCPTPNFDENVYKYHHKSGELEFLWSIPSKPWCLYFINNKQDVPRDMWAALSSALNFYDGTYDKLAMKENGEESLDYLFTKKGDLWKAHNTKNPTSKQPKIIT